MSWRVLVSPNSFFIVVSNAILRRILSVSVHFTNWVVSGRAVTFSRFVKGVSDSSFKDDDKGLMVKAVHGFLFIMSPTFMFVSAHLQFGVAIIHQLVPLP